MDEIRVGEYLVLKDRLYTKTDEWIKVKDDIGIVGITDYAQKKLKDIVGLELPSPGSNVRKGESVAVIESIKAASDIYTPVSGEILEVHEELVDMPETINRDPYGEGWIFKIKIENKDELKELLTPEEYAKKIKSEES